MFSVQVCVQDAPRRPGRADRRARRPCPACLARAFRGGLVGVQVAVWREFGSRERVHWAPALDLSCTCTLAGVLVGRRAGRRPGNSDRCASTACLLRPCPSESRASRHSVRFGSPAIERAKVLSCVVHVARVGWLPARFRVTPKTASWWSIAPDQFEYHSPSISLCFTCA